jgi:hypothetical protein
LKKVFLKAKISLIEEQTMKLIDNGVKICFVHDVTKITGKQIFAFSIQCSTIVDDGSTAFSLLCLK